MLMVCNVFFFVEFYSIKKKILLCTSQNLWSIFETEDLEKKLPLSKQKAAKGGGVMDSLSNFIGTFGRKKGKQVNKAVTDLDKFDTDPDAVISGENTFAYFVTCQLCVNSNRHF